MLTDNYFGTYAQFNTKSKRDAATLLGANCLVGDRFDIVFETEDGVNVAWLKNRFGELVGFFDADLSRQLKVLSARDWSLNGLLSFVAFTDSPEPGHYWGQVALICYDPALDECFQPYMATFANRLADGIRPEAELGEQAVKQIQETKGDWAPKQTVPMPQGTPGTAIVKKSRKMSEKLIEQGRKGNKGCYLVSWLFLLVLVAAIIFGLHSCGLF